MTRHAATPGDLAPLTGALATAHIPHAMEDTGGGCYVVTATTKTTAEEPGVFTLTEGQDTASGAPGTWYAAFWPGTTWQTGDTEEPDGYLLTTEEVTAILTNQCRD